MSSGQSIPAGLHVRMSMKTGLREARLMQDETAPDVKTADEPQQQGRYTQEEIEKALKNIRSSHDSANSSKVP